MKQLSALFRVEVSHRIGLGHLVRSLALAEELDQRGIESVFILGEASAEHVRLVEAKGFAAFKLSCSSGGLLDAAFTRATAVHYRARLCFVDGYRFEPGYYRALKKSDLLLAALDDLGQRALPVDLVINPNAGAEALPYPEARLALRGAPYAILRREFLQQKRVFSSSPRRRLLVTFGGTDPERATEKILRALPSEPLQVTAVVGDSYSGLDALTEAAGEAEGAGHEVRILRGFRPLSPLMQGSDLAISAAGGTLLELSHLEIPTLAFAVAANQIPGATALSDLGALCYGGLWQELRGGELECTLKTFLSAPPQPRGQIIDGRGAARIIDTALMMMAQLAQQGARRALCLQQEEA